MSNWYLNINATGHNNGTSPIDAWNNLSGVTASSFLANDTLWIMGGDYSHHIGMKTPQGNSPSNRSQIGELALNVTHAGITYQIDPLSTTPAIFNSLDTFFPNNCKFDGLISGTYVSGKYSKTIQMIKVLGYGGSNGHGPGSPGGAGAGVSIRGGTGLIVRGIEVDNSNIYYQVNDTNSSNLFGIGVSTAAQNNLILEYNYVHNTIGDALNIDNTNGNSNTDLSNQRFDLIVIRYNYVDKVGDDTIQGASNTDVYGNYLSNGGTIAYYGAHPDSWQVGDMSSYVKVHENVLADAGQMPFYSLFNGEGYIYNNIIISTRQSACGGSTPAQPDGIAFGIAGTGFGNIVIANNLVFNLTAGNGFRNTTTLNTGLNYNLVSKGNIIVNCKNGGAGSFDNAVMDPTTLWWDTTGTTFYDSMGNAQSKPTLNYGTATHVYPGMIDILGWDFHPASGTAPSIGLSPDLSIYGITTDFDGNPRPSGSNWTSGPFEWQGNPITGALPRSTNNIVGLPWVLALTGRDAGGSYGASFPNGINWTRSEPGLYNIIVTGIPPGLIYRTGHGDITGKATTAGSYLVTTAVYSGSTLIESGNTVFGIQDGSGINAPAIANFPFSGGVTGQYFQFGLIASQNPIGFTIGVLPAGLTGDMTSGVISGYPTVGGIYNIPISAFNGYGTGFGNIILQFAGSGAQPLFQTYRRWGAHPQFIFFS